MSNPQSGISLQINISPTEYPLIEKLLPFQIAFFKETIQEIVITVETRRSKGRFGDNFVVYQKKLYDLLSRMSREDSRIRVVDVDYSDNIKKKISALFFNDGELIPDKDFRGGPFYCYFYGLYSCTNPFILHLDSDIMLGGNGDAWLRNALKILSDPTVLFVNPLAGPPTPDFGIKQKALERIDQFTYRFDKVSSRLFLTDLRKLLTVKSDLIRLRPTLKNHRVYLRGLSQGNLWQFPEEILSNTMKRNGLFRLDYWGKNASEGCFSLHPEFKPPHFIDAIPTLWQRLQEGDVPAAQQGWYNVHDDFHNLSVERAALKHPLKKLLRI